MSLLAILHFVSPELREKLSWSEMPWVCGAAWCACQPSHRRSMKWPKNWHFIGLLLGHELVGIHVWSEVNVIADAMRRMGEHGLVPPEL